MDLLIILPIILLPLLSQIYVSNTFNKYSDVRSKSNLSGKDVARKILDSEGLFNVSIQKTEGTLTDYYDPKKKILVLSKNVYDSSSISSIAVSAHESGHAIQDSKGYSYLKLRSALVPLVNFSSRFAMIFIFLGFFLEIINLIDIGIICLLVGLFFQLITLPVEFNASKIASVKLEALGLSDNKDNYGVKKVLKSAAFTYVARFLATALQVLRFILIRNNNK